MRERKRPLMMSTRQKNNPVVGCIVVMLLL
jgi:hypothetical protein